MGSLITTLSARTHHRRKTLSLLLRHGAFLPLLNTITTSTLCHCLNDASSWPRRRRLMTPSHSHIRPPQCCNRIWMLTPFLPLLIRRRTSMRTPNPNLNHHILPPPSVVNRSLPSSGFPTYPYLHRPPPRTLQGYQEWECLPLRPWGARWVLLRQQRNRSTCGNGGHSHSELPLLIPCLGRRGRKESRNRAF